MTQPVVKNRIINFSGFSCGSEEELNCHRQAFNSLMIKMSDLDKYDATEDFTHCEKQDCKMVLTNQDRDYIDDWNWVSSNQEYYRNKGKQMEEKIQKMKMDKYNYYIWNCRFCGTPNLIQKDQAYFAKNKSKVILKQAETDKNYRSDQCPLLLFLIDNSSSMEEEIPNLSKDINNQQIKNFLHNVLKKTEIYQKICQNEKKTFSEIKKKIPDAQNEVYNDNFSKYRVLMGMMEKATYELHNSTKVDGKKKFSDKTGPDRKIGFLFFNSDVILQKNSCQKASSLKKVSHKEFSSESSTQNHLKVDYENFNDLYQLGRSNSENYGMDISNFNFNNIELPTSPPEGQTALGPALVIASGIVSGYGAGSLIVVITDGQANKGIFSDLGGFEDEIALLRLKLNKSRAETCLIKLENLNIKNKQQNQTILHRYFRKYSSIINVSLSGKDPIKELRTRLDSIIEKAIKSKTWTNNIRIKCQNPNIKYNEKDFTRMKKKLFKQHQMQFVTPQVKQLKLTSFDYRHPFMTQIIVEYQNIETRQQSKFMAFIIQKIIKYTEMSKKDQQSVNSMETLQNVLGYLQVEGQKLNLNNIPLSICKQSFQASIMQSYKYSLQKQYINNIMKDVDFENKPERNHFKNAKDFIKSLTENVYAEQKEDENEQTEKL